MCLRVLLLCIALLAIPAAAHEIHHSIEAGPPFVVKLSYADGRPFANEAYEVFAEGQSRPVLSGKTDPQGRVVFNPGGIRQWRIRAFSADGHGIELPIDTFSAGSATLHSRPPRTTLVITGLAILLVLFGLIQLYIRKNASPSRRDADTGLCDS